MKLIKVYKVHNERYIYLTTGKISFIYRHKEDWQGSALKLHAYRQENVTFRILKLGRKSIYDPHFELSTQINLDTAQVVMQRVLA